MKPGARCNRRFACEVHRRQLDDAEEVSLLLLNASWRRHNNEVITVENLVREYLEE
jgi:hypothetical protein